MNYIVKVWFLRPEGWIDEHYPRSSGPFASREAAEQFAAAMAGNPRVAQVRIIQVEQEAGEAAAWEV